MPRYAVLEHTTPLGFRGDGNRVHWDLMLQHEDCLLTWALETQPCVGAPILARQLPDHRLHYLDYEGPISGDRGAVRSIAQGDFSWLERSEACLRIRLEGMTDIAHCTLEQRPDGSWIASFRAHAAA